MTEIIKDLEYYTKLRRLHDEHGIWPFTSQTYTEKETKKTGEYPLLQVIGKVDHEKLLEEYRLTKKTAFGAYKKDNDIELVRKEFSNRGFDPNDATLAVVKSGSGPSNSSHHMILDKIQDHVLPYTSSIIKSYDVFTAQYWWMNKGNYSLDWHIDYKNIDLFGYRMLVPLNTDTYIAFYPNTVYRLELGYIYRINPTVLHRGFCNHDKERIHLMMASHTRYDNGQDLTPITGKFDHPEIDIFWLL